MKPALLDKPALLSKIKSKFHQNSPPTYPEGWEKFTGDMKFDNYWEGIEETKPFWGKNWGDLSLEDFAECRRVFSFLPDENIAYFLGGYMTLSIKEEPYDYDFTELFYLFDPRGWPRKRAKRTWAMNRMKIAPFNAGQRAIIAEYLKFLEASGFEEHTTFMQGFILGTIQE